MNDADPYSTVNHSFVIVISCVATIGGFLFGFDSGVINGPTPDLTKAQNSAPGTCCPGFISTTGIGLMLVLIIYHRLVGVAYL